MKTIEDYLEDVKKKAGITSDYALAKKIDMTRQGISSIRRGGSIRNETAMKIAEVLEIEPEEILLQATLERAKDLKQRRAWEKISKKLNSVAMVLVVVFAGFSGDAEARDTDLTFNAEYTLHAVIVASDKTRFRRIMRIMR